MALSVYPGVLWSPCFMPFLLLSISFALGIWWLTLAVKERGRAAAGGGLIALVILGGLYLRVPRRLAFVLIRHDIEVRVEKTLRETRLPIPNDRPWGRTGDCLVDPRGGVYIATRQSAHVIDTVTWGYVWRPNSEGTPFGNAQVSLRPLQGEWYEFFANNDW